VQSKAAMGEMDVNKRTDLITKFCQDALLDVGFIPMANPYLLNCYWPWLKNYYGEIESGYFNEIPMIKEIWIDQSLKKSLGY